MLDRRNFLKSGALLGASTAMPALGSDATVAVTARFEWNLRRPETAGMTAAGIDGIRLAIQDHVDAKHISGAVIALARRNKLVMFEALGWADIAARRPMRLNSLFRMMSSSKVVTAVAVMAMIEEGKLNLEDPVSRYVPTFRGQRVNASTTGASPVAASRDITIADLLTHTSGLASVGDGIPSQEGLTMFAPKATDTLATAIPRLGEQPLGFQPGSKWRYSPLAGMDTLLYLVEQVSGVRADRFLRERIFEPLDMRHTYFNVPASERGRLVKIYAAKDGAFEVRPSLLGEGPVTYFSGAAGLLSCAHDMLNFEIMLLNQGSFNGRQLLKPATVAAMSTNHVGKLFADWIPFITGGSGFGYGVSVVEDESRAYGRGAGAFGWGGAYGTETWADPKLEVAAALLVQMNPAPASTKADVTKAIRKAIVA